MKSIDTKTTVSASAERNLEANYAFARVTLTNKDVASIVETINNLQAMLPALPALTPLERKRMSKLGLKTRGFVDLAIESARKDEGVLPRAIELETLLAQDELMKNLSLIQAHLSDMKSKVDDALLVSGNWLFGATRSIYAVLKTPAARTRMPEQQDALKLRFARPAKKKDQASEAVSA
jgi:hypothetical protein